MTHVNRPDEKMGISADLLRSRVFKQIEQEIISGKYAFGESLTEKELAEKMGVSRTPIREAFRQLELKGLVQSIPNKGVIVTGIAKRDIEDIFSIKIAMEGIAARLAAERITCEEIAELEKTIALSEQYVEKNDMQGVLEQDSRFHEIIFAACKNRPLMLVLNNFHNYVQRARNDSLATPGRAKKSLMEHQLIMEAIKKRHPDQAEKLLQQHIQNTVDNLHSIS
ncbi:MAG: GntR family transcriptional regulator [Bacillota bacterium]|jgi:DNA-binding GntR family transcriptional regulator